MNNKALHVYYITTLSMYIMCIYVICTQYNNISKLSHNMILLHWIMHTRTSYARWQM